MMMSAASVNAFLRSGMLVGLLVGSSMAHALESPQTELLSALQKVISQQAQELLLNTQREVASSLKVQLKNAQYGLHEHLPISNLDHEPATEPLSQQAIKQSINE